MTVYFICEYKPISHQGGVQRVTNSLKEFFQGKGFNVVILFFNSLDNEEENGLMQYGFPSNIILSQENQNFLNKISRKHSPDLVINQFGFEKEVKKLVSSSLIPSIPFLSVLHSAPDFELTFEKIRLPKSLSFENKGKDNLKIFIKPLYFFFLRQKLKRKLNIIYTSSSKTILLSEKFIPIFQKLTGLNQTPKLLAISNPLPKIFASGFHLSTLEKEKKVLFIGRLNRGKRVDLLLEVWKEVHNDFPGWKFEIVGDGPELNHLNKLSKSLNLKNITFHGQSDNVEYYYQTASIFVSLSAFEGFPLTLAEAQIFGTIPIVYNTYESVTDLIIDNETGYIAPNLNQELFVKKLKHLMRSDEQRNRMAKNAIEFAKKFDVEQIGREWISLFENVKK